MAGAAPVAVRIPNGKIPVPNGKISVSNGKSHIPNGKTCDPNGKTIFAGRPLYAPVPCLAVSWQR